MPTAGPFVPVAMPGLNFRSWNCVRVKLLTISDSDPCAMTTICRGSPEEANVVRKPLTSASTASSTATVKRDAESRHHGGGLPDHQISKVVGNGDGHGMVSVLAAHPQSACASAQRRDPGTDESR